MFSELNSMLNEVLNDYNKALDDIVKLKKDLDWYKNYALAVKIILFGVHSRLAKISSV